MINLGNGDVLGRGEIKMGQGRKKEFWGLFF